MRSKALSLVLVLLPALSLSRPPLKQHGDGPSEGMEMVHDTVNSTKDWDLGIEYNRYLQEIVQVFYTLRSW